VFAGYSYFASYTLRGGPTIKITTPGNGMKPIKGIIYASVSTSTVIVTGVAQRVRSISINGRPIVVDEAGNFSQPVALFPGYNVETLVGQDAFGHTTSVELEIESVQ
jgi:hypothetical protein